MQETATLNRRASWLGPIAFGVAAILVAFFVASYLAGSESGVDPADQLIADLESRVWADPNNADLRVAVADTYLKAGRPSDALVQYQEALRLSEDREEAIYGMGLAYRELGDLDQAGAAFQTVVKLGEGDEMSAVDRRLQGAHYYLGLILRDQGNLDDAINELRVALSLNRSDADTLLQLGRTFAMKGEYEDAISALQVALAFVPDFIDAYTELEMAAKASGNETEAAFASAMILVFDGKPKKAIPALEEVTGQAEDSRYWWGLGIARERAGDSEGAMAAYQKAVDVNPGELLAADALRRLQEETEP